MTSYLTSEPSNGILYIFEYILLIAENICIRKCAGHLFLKICDFGSAKEEKEPPDFQGCTVEYLSPELGIQLITTKYQNHGLLGNNISNFIMTTKSDIFSLALTVMFIYRKGHVVISLFNNGNMTYNGLDQATITKIRQTILVYVSDLLCGSTVKSEPWINQTYLKFYLFFWMYLEPGYTKHLSKLYKLWSTKEVYYRQVSL